MKGLPGDLCQCPHWASGHAPVALEDTECVDLSPTDEFGPVLDHLTGTK